MSAQGCLNYLQGNYLQGIFTYDLMETCYVNPKNWHANSANVLECRVLILRIKMEVCVIISSIVKNSLLFKDICKILSRIGPIILQYILKRHP